jgi:drug/metabolite transporter (DMT)-like permease
VLTATEPLFILPLAAVMLRERISLRATSGATLAVIGVVLILLALT